MPFRAGPLRAGPGQIRYMNYDGCKRKFKIDAYVAKVRALVAAAGKKPKS